MSIPGPMGRPTHPDFWALVDVVLWLDGQAGEGARDIGEIVGQVIDAGSLLYVAEQRALRAVGPPRTGAERQTFAMLQATYLEAFVVGARYRKDR